MGAKRKKLGSSIVRKLPDSIDTLNKKNFTDPNQDLMLCNLDITKQKLDPLMDDIISGESVRCWVEKKQCFIQYCIRRGTCLKAGRK